MVVRKPHNSVIQLVLSLTHYQTTNFRLFQTERVCRWRFQIWRKWQKVIQTGRKHCCKRRNCSLWAISPFPTVFSKGLFPRGIVWEGVNSLPNDKILNQSKLKTFADNKIGVSEKLKFDLGRVENIVVTGVSYRVIRSRDCVVKGLTLYHTIITFNASGEKDFWKHCGKRRKCW